MYNFGESAHSLKEKENKQNVMNITYNQNNLQMHSSFKIKFLI
jgi:hypothetical protein